MNTHSNNQIQTRLHEHLKSALSSYPGTDWFVICLQGSQNYNLADESSDIDSKLLVFPKFKDLVFNKAPVSHTHVMPNDERCDVKDIREYFKMFKKQNVNFVEILFTDNFIVNETYLPEWSILQKNRELIAQYNPYQALSCMQGMALAKRHALCHEYPSRMDWIEKFGYDPKQLSHLLRFGYFAEDYIAGKTYSECLDASAHPTILQIKRGKLPLSVDTAISLADDLCEKIRLSVQSWCNSHEPVINEVAETILNDTLYALMTKSLKNELATI